MTSNKAVLGKSNNLSVKKAGEMGSVVLEMRIGKDSTIEIK